MGTLLLLLIGAAVLLTLLTLLARRLRTGRPLLYPFVTNMPHTPMKIYIDIDGTLIHEDLGPNFGQPAAGLGEFIKALRPYDVYWLTTHCMDGDPAAARTFVKHHLPEELHPDIDRIKPTTWYKCKHEALDFDSDFLWFDNAPAPEDLMVLQRGGPHQRLVHVDLINNPTHLIDLAHEFFDT